MGKWGETTLLVICLDLLKVMSYGFRYHGMKITMKHQHLGEDFWSFFPSILSKSKFVFEQKE